MDKEKRIEELLKKQKEYFLYKINAPDLKEILVGVVYRDIGGINREILDVEFLRPNFINFRTSGSLKLIWEGLALLLDDNVWRFGCPLDAKHFQVPAIKHGQLIDIFAKLAEGERDG